MIANVEQAQQAPWNHLVVIQPAVAPLPERAREQLTEEGTLTVRETVNETA